MKALIPILLLFTGFTSSAQDYNVANRSVLMVNKTEDFSIGFYKPDTSGGYTSVKFERPGNINTLTFSLNNEPVAKKEKVPVDYFKSVDENLKNLISLERHMYRYFTTEELKKEQQLSIRYKNLFYNHFAHFNEEKLKKAKTEKDLAAMLLVNQIIYHLDKELQWIYNQ